MVKKISEITAQDVANYCHIDEYDEQEILTYLNIAKEYISNYTGISITGEGETLDDHSDFVIVAYVLCQDMYDNRSMYVDSKMKSNMVVQTILDMHQRNLL